MSLTEQEEFELLSLEREKTMGIKQQEQPQQIQQTVNQPNISQDNEDKIGLLNALLIGGGGMVGYDIYQGKLVPKIHKSYLENIQKQDAINTLTTLQNKLGIQNTQIERIPTKIGELEKSNKILFEQNKTKLEYDFGLSLKNAKSALEDFDNKILSSKIEETASVLREAHPILKQNFNKGYEAGKQALESYLADKGIKFNSFDFEQGFLDKVIQRSVSEGALPEELSPLLRLKESIASKMVGNFLETEKPISFTQMRGYISGITKNYPNNKISPILNEEWLNFLDSKLSSDVSPIIKEGLNKLKIDYKQFANADRQLSSLIGKTGEFNTDKLNAYLMRHIKSNIDNGIQELSSFIAKGNEIGEGVSGVMDKINELSKLKGERGELIRQIPQIKQLQQEALNKNADKFIKKANQLLSWKSKYNDLISMLAKQQEGKFGNAIKNIFRGLKTIGKVGRGAGIVGMAYLQIIDLIRFSQDPEAYIYGLETGGTKELAPKDSIEREIQTGRLL